MVRNRKFYEESYMQSLGPVHITLKNVSNNYCFSESYEIQALCHVLECNIRTFCPSIELHPHVLAMLNKVFSPMPSNNAKCTITILWSHTMTETDAKAMNHGNWSPNHFVPLLPSGSNVALAGNPVSPTVTVNYINDMLWW